MELNPSQLRAVSFGSGPCLVLAGPGSGKTTVMIRRLQNLISEYNVRPENILAVTFSRAAAREMSDRFAASCTECRNAPLPSGSQSVTFGTVHSIFLRILKEDLRKCISVISSEESRSFILHEIDRCSIPCQSAETMCRELLLSISSLKAGALSKGGPGDPSGRRDPEMHVSGSSVPWESFLKIFSDYSMFLKERSLFDYDDIISETYRLLRQSPAVLSKWQERFKFLNIDEFQDLSLLQYHTLMLLAGDAANVFAVGDDDQGIYGFRGAGSGIMQRFAEDFPGAERIILDVNYRCRSDIIDASAAVIRENKDRFEKHFIPSNEGGVVTFSAFAGRIEEYKDIFCKLRELTGSGKDCAVLFRSSFDYYLFVLMLRKEGIRFECRDEAGGFADRFAVRDVCSYLKTAVCLAERSPQPCREEMLRIINRPERYLRRESLIKAASGSTPSGSAASCFEAMKAFYGSDTRMLSMVKKLQADLLMISSLSPFAAIKYIRKALGYDNWMKKYAAGRNLDPDECMESLNLLEIFSSGCASIRELLSVTAGRGLVLGRDADDPEKTGKVSVMTMHASKGLEFDAVLLPDVNEGIIPCKSAVHEGTIDEERRLFYVAMTRARDELHVSYVNEYRYKPAEASRFIRNLL